MSKNQEIIIAKLMSADGEGPSSKILEPDDTVLDALPHLQRDRPGGAGGRFPG